MSAAQISHEIFSAFAVYAGLVLVKTLIMSFLTARQRIGKGLFANPEDAANGGKVVFGAEDVERVRRAHQNDLENILPFVLIGGLYITTNPTVFAAKTCFRVFAAARYLHTFVYLFAVPQPSRALAFAVGQGVCMYMGYCVITQYWGHL